MKILIDIPDPPKAVDPATGKAFEWSLEVNLLPVPAGAPVATIGTSLAAGPAAPPAKAPAETDKPE